MKAGFKNFNMRLAGLIILLCLSLAQVAHAQKKNLLFIITDQQRYDAMSIAGNTVLKTPNLDRLADEGAYFKNAYTPCAVCGPARSSILTGCSVETTGVYSNGQTYDDADESVVMTMPTFDEILNDNGYDCEYYGKWHAVTSKGDVYENSEEKSSYGKTLFDSGGKVRFYWDYLKEAVGPAPAPGAGEFVEDISKWPYIANPLDNYYGMSHEQLQADGIKHIQPEQHGVLQLPSEHSITAYTAGQTLKALERLKDKTFSLTCSFHFPHTPMTPTEKYFSMYPVDVHAMPASINDKMANSPYVKSNSRVNQTEYADPTKLKYMMSEYYGLITEIDDWVGAILDKLDELGLAENTMIIFTSDHGEMLGAHGMREKNVFLEESAHIPLLIKCPGDVPAQTTVNGYVSLIDLFPTILDYLEVPEHESEGKSLRGLIEGTDTTHGKYVVTEWDRDNIPNLMIVKDGWKLIIPDKASSTVINAMYDLNTDPHEMNNLLGSNPDRAQYQVKAEELRASLLEWLAKNNSAHYFSVSQRDLLNGGGPTGNNASFVSQVVPTLEKGETITVSITMKNTGTTTWTPEGNFKLGSQSPEDNTIWGLDRVNLNVDESIAPNFEKTFTFEIVVPNSDGIYNFQWKMIQEGEEWFGSKSAIQQLTLGDPGGYLDVCDDKTDWKSSAVLLLNTTDKQQGIGCIEFTGDSSKTDEFKKVFTTPYNANGTESGTVLKFWYYVSDPSKRDGSNQVEIGSGGKADSNEYNWSLASLSLSAGWNFIELNTNQAGKIGDPNLNAINWFRIYSRKSGSITTRIDAIQLIGENSLAIDDIVVEKSFTLFPNPADTEIYVNFTLTNSAAVSITIMNMNGQPVSQNVNRPELNPGNHRLEVPVNTLNSGIYFASIKINDAVFTKKVIIE